MCDQSDHGSTCHVYREDDGNNGVEPEIHVSREGPRTKVKFVNQDEVIKSLAMSGSRDRGGHAA